MEVNLFHVLGSNIVDCLTKEERAQIDAISTRLSGDANFKGVGDRNSVFHDIFSKKAVERGIARSKALAEDGEAYRKSVEESFSHEGRTATQYY